MKPQPRPQTPADLLHRRICSVDDCDSIHYGHGLCQMHLSRLRRGVPLDKPRVIRTWDSNNYRVLDDGCWEWLGSTSTGYGCFRRGYAHRYSYELHKGAIPDGLQIDHLCRNRLCVNPDHLEAVTVRVNVLRGVSRVAANARQSHCIRGHEFTPENTRRRANGSRACRECGRQRGRAKRGTGPAMDPPVMPLAVVLVEAVTG